MLTLCMIVKNEEDTLGNCLASVINLVDEIIIVDTGSTDRTKSVASMYTDRIYDYNWCNDFSKARNYSIQFAQNDWILVLDGDEEVINVDKDQIYKFIQDNNEVIGRIHRSNIIDDTNDIKIYNEKINRLFNRKFYKYTGKIHEQLVPIYLSKNKVNLITVPIFVNHIGYKEQVIKKTNKIQRNIDILLEEIDVNRHDSYLFYQLGKSYYLNKQYRKAIEVFEKSISLLDNYSYEYAEDLFETYGYSMINAKEYFKALELLQYDEYFNNSDFIFIKSLILMNNSRFQEAAEGFLECTKFKDCKSYGVNSFKAFYNIGVIFQVLGFEGEAKQYYQLCNDYKPAIKRLGELRL